MKIIFDAAIFLAFLGIAVAVILWAFTLPQLWQIILASSLALGAWALAVRRTIWPVDGGRL